MAATKNHPHDWGGGGGDGSGSFFFGRVLVWLDSIPAGGCDYSNYSNYYYYYFFFFYHQSCNHRYHYEYHNDPPQGLAVRCVVA